MLRRHRRWPIVLAAVLGALAFALLIAQDQEVLYLRSPIAASDPRFIDYVASLVGARVTTGDAYTVLQNGDEIYPAMLDAVAHARRRISFESFIYSKGEISDRFTSAFADAARRGVAVRVVLDSFGSMDLPTDSVRLLESAGVGIGWFNPLRQWTLEEANYRTHRKTLVVDGEVAFTGGVGLADHWRGHAQDRDHWRDTQFKVTGPAVRTLEASFYENWLESGGQSAPALDPEEPPLATGARSVVIWSNPVGGASNIKLLFLLSIAGAREAIDIQSPYFITDGSTGRALDEARARGVRVRILTEGDATDARSVKYASRHAYQQLLDSGYELFEYQPTMMHVKVMVIDGCWSVFGSANFDNRSLELNDEIAVAAADAGLARTLTAAFDQDLTRSKRLDAESWRARSVFSKAPEAFWSLFGEVF